MFSLKNNIFLHPHRCAHRHGFGIQSPWAYDLVHDVIGEKLPYYAFAPLRDLMRQHRGALKFSRRHHEMLFRLSLWHHPSHIFTYGLDAPVMAACYLAAPCTQTPVTCLYRQIDERQEQLLNRFGIQSQEALAFFQGHHGMDKRKILFHIESAHNLPNLLETVVFPLMNQDCMVVIDGLGSFLRKKLWLQLMADKRITVSFDLGKTVILFFDTKRYKQNYTL